MPKLRQIPSFLSRVLRVFNNPRNDEARDVRDVRYDLEESVESVESGPIRTTLPNTPPREVSGTVSFVYHVELEASYDMVAFDEYEGFEVMMPSALFAKLAIEVGKAVTLTIEERSGAFIGATDTIFWATRGRA